MSEQRARSSSSTEMTDSKRRAIVTEPVEEFEFTFCEDGVDSPVDRHFSILHRDYSPIYHLFNALPLVPYLVAKILENPSDFLDTAKLRMEAFMKLAAEGVPIPDEDAQSLLHGVWLHPCFFHSLVAAIEYKWSMISSVLPYQKQVSVADRVAHMEADPNFSPSVMGLKEPISKSTFLRLFLSILIGHWTDERLLRELDQKAGKDIFGRRLDLIAKGKALDIESAGKEDEIEEFSYVIDDINQAKDMEPLRKLMVDRYGSREDRDIEAILEKNELDELYFLLSITRDHLGYDGKKAKIYITVINGRIGGISMEAIRSAEAN